MTDTRINRLETRAEPWAFGKDLHSAGINTSADAIKLAGMDWTVEEEPVYVKVGNKYQEVPNTIANFRSDTHAVLGIRTEKYKIVQNHEAFDFIDSLVGSHVIEFDRAGIVNKGSKIWMTVNFESYKLLDDVIKPFLVLENNHDGKGSMRVAIVPLRIACSNALNLAFKCATRKWSIRHMGNMNLKMAQAHETLKLANQYNNIFKERAEKLALEKVGDKEFLTFVENLIPLNDEMSDRRKKNALELQEGLKEVYYHTPDLDNFRGTKWGILGAVSDFSTHKKPQRATDTYDERLFSEVVNGNKMLDKASELLGVA